MTSVLLSSIVAVKSHHPTSESLKKHVFSNIGLKYTIVVPTESNEIPTMVTEMPHPLVPPEPTPSIFKYVEEPPAGNEFKRLIRALSTQGAVCSDLRRVGGLAKGPHGAPRPFGPDGMWYVCFDEEVDVQPGSCVVYSVG